MGLVGNTIHVLYPIAKEETKQYIGNSRLGRDFGISVMLCVNCLDVPKIEMYIHIGQSSLMPYLSSEG